MNLDCPIDLVPKSMRERDTMLNQYRPIPDMARVVGITQQTLRDWVRKGAIQSFTFEGKVVIKNDKGPLEELKKNSRRIMR